MDTIKYYPQSRKKRLNKHLNSYEHGQIALLTSDSLSTYAITKKLNRSPNTIRAQILRGFVSQIKNGNIISACFPDVAERKYLVNLKLCRPKFKLLACAPFIDYADSKFPTNHFSFDAICGQAIISNLFPKPLLYPLKHSIITSSEDCFLLRILTCPPK